MHSTWPSACAEGHIGVSPPRQTTSRRDERAAAGRAVSSVTRPGKPVRSWQVRIRQGHHLDTKVSHCLIGRNARAAVPRDPHDVLVKPFVEGLGAAT